MNEYIIYFEHATSTKDMRDAGTEALDWDLRVIDTLAESLLDNRVPFHQAYADSRVKLMLHDSKLSYTMRRGWKNAKFSLVRVMGRVHLLHSLEATDRRIAEFMSSEEIRSTQEALDFLNNTRKRINYLASPEGQKKLDSFKWSGLAYVETRVLERAVYDKHFLVKPGSHFRYSTS